MILKDEIEEEKRWLEEMVALSRQIPWKQDQRQLSHDELLIRDFVNGEGIFAEDHR
jgi:hypothetical protein